MAEDTKRIRIGLTGLAFVFLLVVLGAAITNLGLSEAEPVSQEVANKIEEKPTEPLAEIGAAPGESSASTTAVPNAEQEIAEEKREEAIARRKAAQAAESE